MDWKNILALAVLTAPMAWCTADTYRASSDADARKAEACFQSGGTWTPSWGGTCAATP